MAAITITEILGGDNIAGSRLTINDNFKKLANGLNTVETLLNTSPAGGALTVGDIQVSRFSRQVGDSIFRCQASGAFNGNLSVSLDLNVSQNINAALDLTASRNITFDGTAGSGSFTSGIKSNFNGQFGSTQMFSSTPVDPQTLSPQGNTTRDIVSVNGYRVLRIDLSTYADGVALTNCNTVILPSVGPENQGQILTIIVDSKSINAMSNFTIAPGATFAPGSMTTGIVFGAPNTDAVYRQAVTVFGDRQGWRVLSSTGVTIS